MEETTILLNNNYNTLPRSYNMILYIVPSPSETWFWGMSVGGSLRRGITLERCSQSVETRRRYGWLRMVFPGAHPFRAPIWCSSGGGGTQEAGSTVADSLVAFYRVGTHQIQRGRRTARSSTSQGSAETLRVRVKGANREVFEGKADL